MDNNAVVTKKIGFYSVQLVKRNDPSQILLPERLKEVIDYISKLKKTDRKREMLDNVFYFLSDVATVTDQPSIQTLVFKQAKYGKRPPLINKDTLDERENPKKLPEGEQEKVHIALHYKDDEIVLLLEEKSGISIKRFIYYLEEFANQLYNQLDKKRDYKLIYSTIAKKDFLTELNNLKRVFVGYVTTSKQLLGSEYLNLSDRTEEVRDNITIEIKAEKKRSIKDFFAEVYNSFVSSDKEIKKIRVYGFDDDDFGVTLDTEIIKRIQHLTLGTNILTGEIDSPAMLSKLISILKNL